MMDSGPGDASPMPDSGGGPEAGPMADAGGGSDASGRTDSGSVPRDGSVLGGDSGNAGGADSGDGGNGDNGNNASVGGCGCRVGVAGGDLAGMGAAWLVSLGLALRWRRRKRR
jgi:MYXO-CTERM domain-containing protein